MNESMLHTLHVPKIQYTWCTFYKKIVIKSKSKDTKYILHSTIPKAAYALLTDLKI
jgi:hypothetical protein